MHDRRKFLKRFLAGGVVLGLGSGASTKANARPAGINDIELPRGYAWQRTIFCQFANPYLASSIGWLAKDLNCDICWGEPFSPDIFAIPNFVVIMDRSTLDREGWEEFLAFRKEVEDSTPCILMDGLSASEGWATDERMEVRDPGNKVHVRSILDRVREARRAAQDWRPGEKE